MKLIKSRKFLTMYFRILSVLSAIFSAIAGILAFPLTCVAALSLEKAHNTEGFSNNCILSLLQDRMGYVWAGSYDGLMRYDGKRVDVFRFELDNPDCLSGNVVGELFPGEDDNIWVLTTMGLDRFSTISLKATAHFPQIRADRQKLAVDPHGNVFSFSPDGTLTHLDPVAGKFVAIPLDGLPAYKDILNMLADGAGSLYFICTDGRVMTVGYDFTKGHAIGKAVFRRKPLPLHDAPIVAALSQKDGFYFVDSKGLLFQYTFSGKVKRRIADLAHLPFGRISGIARIGDDFIIGFYGIGVGRLADGDRFEMFSTEVGVFGVMADTRQPLVWCATDGLGLFKVYDAKTRYHVIASRQIPGLSKPIRCFNTDDSGNLWIGTKGDGLIMLAGYRKYGSNSVIPAQSIRRYDDSNGLPDNQVFSIVDSRFHPGRKWIATRGPGISYMKIPEGKIVNIYHPAILDIHDIYEQNDSVLWLASTTGGLIRTEISGSAGTERIAAESVKSFVFKRDPYVCNEMHSLAFDGDSILFVGCRGGLGVVRFNIFTHSYDFISDITDRFPTIGDVICLTYSDDSKLYFGSSAGAGIIDYANPDTPPHILTRNDGMINDMAHSILHDDNGHVWIGTNKGLVRFDMENSVMHNITGFESQVIEFCDNAGYRSPYDGDLFFGALNGIVRVSAEKTQFPGSSGRTPFHFNALQINGRDRNLHDMLSEDGTLSLASDENTISISFSALDYIKGDDFNYYYMLEGYDDEWVNLGTDPHVVITNLPPGEYMLKVTYKSDYADSGEKVYILPISVRRPWYYSTAAILFYIVLASASVLTVICLTRNYYRRKRGEFEKALFDRQQEQLYADRMEFFRNITHELCAPLTMIMGLCEKLHNDADADQNGKLERYVSLLRQHSSHLNDLVQEILDIKQMQDPDFRIIRVQPISLENIFSKWVLSFKEIGADNGITFETELDNPDIRWNTDPGSIGKIITNLISNALKYTPERGTVRVSCLVKDDGLHFSVYNTGGGISPEECKTLFDKYTMFNNAVRNGYSDIASRHGLGLYICKGLVDKLKGSITVCSVPGEYTRFDVVLPRLEVTEWVKPGKSDPALLSDSSDRLPVLVVDDNPDILWLVSEILSGTYEVIKASGAAEAFEKIKQKLPSLIITDLMMPDTDGLEFTAELRKNRYTKNIPILILSAKITEINKIKGYASGADEYMTKPFSPEFLRVVVDRMITRKKADKDYYHSSESVLTLHDGMEITNEDKAFFDKLKEYILDNIEDENKLKPAELAAAMGMEVRTLYRKFKKSSPYTPTEFVKNYRYTYAAQLLLTTNATIQEIIYKVGLSNKTMFYADFKKIYGMTPKEYRDAQGVK